MRVLVACEFSGTVRRAFAARGHDAWSCDLLPATDDGPHIRGDALAAIRRGWNLVIAHPPCTHIAVSGARHFAMKKKDGRFQAGVRFFKDVVRLCQLHADKYAVENPVCVMSKLYMRPSQIIQPWMFGHPETKTTCLWLRGVPPLVATNDVRDAMLRLPIAQRARVHHLPPSPLRWALRSKTYDGIAAGMAEQWG